MYMKKLFALLGLSILIVTLIPASAFAAKPTRSGSPKPAPSTEMKGYDVSYPQCGKRLPTDHYFGIVGINGGMPTTNNPCLGQQLSWAKNAKTGSNQPKIQLYVNTANPAQESAYSWASWPTSGIENNPYGQCLGIKTNDLACSWQYGWNRSIETESYFKSEAQKAGISTNTGDYTWWLDVETMNSWQAGSAEALARNTATIEGFGAYFESKGADIGLYSTAVQWTEITGNNISTDSNLNGLPNWRPSGASLSNAKANCGVASLTPGGYISLTQYVIKNLDHNHSCI